MSQDNHHWNGAERKTGQLSQDALRHEQDAAHHKVHKSTQAGKSAQSGRAENSGGQLPQRGSQEESGDLNELEADQQPEVPKVGSRDAPGG